MIDWSKTTKEDALTIVAIARRAHADLGMPFAMTEMDLTACHTNGCPLKLTELLAAPPFDFAHDLCGIAQCIDRLTGKLSEQFGPRYAA